MADPANSALGRMLLDEITPVVMVLPTPLVEESCQKNGLSLIQLLSPFCNFNTIDVPVRTASDQPYRLQKFKLRLFYASDIRQPDIEVAKERLKQVITHAGEKDLSDLSLDPPEIGSVLAASKVELLPSWFQYFNRELVRSVSFSDHEAFDHPVACLLAVSSRDEDPINKFVDLFNTNQLPPLLNDGSMDPKILKHFLLVHDNKVDDAEKAAKILTEMRSTFGANECHLLCINSSEDGFLENQVNPWASYKNDSSQIQQPGCFLNIEDIDELRKTMQDLSSKNIIPYMEQKIRDLNHQVSATRKGFRNQIKNLWWRKGKEETTDNPSGTMYTFSSIESQIRVLGDYAFMLRDYELALSNYRLLSTDYKLDKAWKRYAGVQEMMGLTYFMLDQSRKDAEYCMENAFNTYIKTGSSGMRNATRCGLWWVEILKARDQHKEAATIYFRISGEEPLHSAVMLEQASYCYLFSTQPMLRKYGFHLVLSGDLYKKCDQIKHAVRTYRSALSVFKGTTWSHITDHVNFHLGKWFASLRMFDLAIKHLLEVLACCHQSKRTQELFLQDFFQIVQETGKTFEVSKLQLPVINTHSVKVVFEDYRTYASKTARDIGEHLWMTLEDDMIPSFSSAKTNWLELQSKILPKKYNESNISVAGEAIWVDIEFKNPLQVPISVSGVSLICKHSAKTDEMESDANSSTDHQNAKESETVGISGKSSDVPPLVLSGVDVLLAGGETVMVHLGVTPEVEGTLTIVGVRWKLSGSVAGYFNFSSESMRKKLASGRRKSKQIMRDNLKFLVINSLPKLEGFISTLPTSVYVGDLRRLTLELKNSSVIPVKNLKMKVSPARILDIGKEEFLNVEVLSCLGKDENFAQNYERSKASKISDAAFLFPKDTLIHGENQFQWPLWLRAADPGNISLCIAIYYEMEALSSIMTYRTLRMHYNLEVLPSLDVSFQINRCPSRLQEYVVRMDVVNRTSSESFQVQQLSSVGNQWELSLLQPIDKISPLKFLTAGQALSCFFKLKNCRTTENEIPSEKANLRLCQDHRALVDIYSSPLVKFHQYERIHQRTSDQEHQDTIDFVLVSHLENGYGLGQQSSVYVLSHHICNYSIRSTSPIWWIIDAPRTVRHDFANSFCEVKLRMTIHNSQDTAISLRIRTFDSVSDVNSLSNGSSQSGNEAGWYDLSVSSDIKVSSGLLGTQLKKSSSAECASPFIWSATSSTRMKLEPLSSCEIPMQICVFSPGTYDISSYSLHWSILSSVDQAAGRAGLESSSGSVEGYSKYLTVLQV